MVTIMSVQIFPTRSHIAGAAADLVSEYITSAQNPTLGLAGGSTPADLYRELTTRSIPWETVTCWLGDERWVPTAHSDSNTTMARRLLTEATGVRFLAPDTSLATPQEAAAAYAEMLPPPGLVLLGIGDDGHTASLFPHTEGLRDTRDTYIANWVGQKDTWRLTATFSRLERADHIVFLVAGEGKADRVKEIVDLNIAHPAQRVAARSKRVTWMLDEPAAAALSLRHRRRA
jgi:6-phosphogluconolactonase